MRLMAHRAIIEKMLQLFDLLEKWNSTAELFTGFSWIKSNVRKDQTCSISKTD
jgi:hypothetical protein